MSTPRLRYAVRDQVEMRCESLEQMLPPEHAVRGVWQFVCARDLTAFLKQIEALPGKPGAPAFDPRVLITLWLQATLDGVGSARELSRLYEHHLVYRWICGDVAINHHTLSDFRLQRSEALDALLTESAAILLEAGVAKLERVAQDGMKVRAGAGTSSFRRAATLQEHLTEAKEQVEALKSQLGDDGGAVSRRTQSAWERAARERVERLQAATAEMEKLQAANAARAATPKNRAQAKPVEKLRVSTTDPEARTMKMGDHGYRPAYNVQFSTTTEGGVICGVQVTNAGTDYGELEPMLDQIQERFGQKPAEVLADGGFATNEVIERLNGESIDAYMPQKKSKTADAAKDTADPEAKPARKSRKDSPAVTEWRERMNSAEGQTIYRQRASTAEWVNAMARNRGLQQFNVRGLEKVNDVARWYALTHNLQRWMTTRP